VPRRQVRLFRLGSKARFGMLDWSSGDYSAPNYPDKPISLAVRTGSQHRLN
jgi:hypothetical protein